MNIADKQNAKRSNNTHGSWNMQFRDRTPGFISLWHAILQPKLFVLISAVSPPTGLYWCRFSLPVMFSSLASAIQRTVFLSKIFSSRQQTTSLCRLYFSDMHGVSRM